MPGIFRTPQRVVSCRAYRTTLDRKVLAAGEGRNDRGIASRTRPLVIARRESDGIERWESAFLLVNAGL
jgi:hypothetical protein